MSAITVRKSGCKRFPWEAKCSQHISEHTYFDDDLGVVAFNTRGIGNRTWFNAMCAVQYHIRNYH